MHTNTHHTRFPELGSSRLTSRPLDICSSFANHGDTAHKEANELPLVTNRLRPKPVSRPTKTRRQG
jgi:hypothetical protein